MKEKQKLGTKCQCDNEGIMVIGMENLYDAVTERPFVNHKPNECKCTNDLNLFKRKGTVLTLCSCCSLSTDERIHV